MKSLKSLCEHYFELFSNKDIEGLSYLFSDNIKLKDWLVNIRGKEIVLEEMNKLFNVAEKIKIDIRELHEECDTVCCELKIEIQTNDDKVELEVVDILKFDNLFKIKKITAYKI